MRNCKSLLLLMLLIYFASCSPVIIGRPYPEGEGRSEHNDEALGIPKGHLPPPGHCRIWYPRRPAGQQPPPFKCGISRQEIPLGVQLVQRVSENVVEVEEYDEQEQGVIKNSYTYRLNE